jgi:hypothetical protein
MGFSSNTWEVAGSPVIRVEKAVSEWLRMQESNFYRDGIFEVVPRLDNCINVLGDFVEK